MKKYNIPSPSLEGILSDDFLYFEGIKRPSNLLFSKDGYIYGDKDSEILERYFNDIYNLLLRKVSYFVTVSNPSGEDIVKVQALLQELIKVKKLLAESNDSKLENLV